MIPIRPQWSAPSFLQTFSSARGHPLPVGRAGPLPEGHHRRGGHAAGGVDPGQVHLALDLLLEGIEVQLADQGHVGLAGQHRRHRLGPGRGLHQLELPPGLAHVALEQGAQPGHVVDLGGGHPQPAGLLDVLVGARLDAGHPPVGAVCAVQADRPPQDVHLQRRPPLDELVHGQEGEGDLVLADVLQRLPRPPEGLAAQRSGGPAAHALDPPHERLHRRPDLVPSREQDLIGHHNLGPRRRRRGGHGGEESEQLR